MILFENHSMSHDFKFKDNGQLIEADMDNIGIQRSMDIGKKLREVLKISLQRCVWINHKKSMERLQLTEKLKNKKTARKVREKRKASQISYKIDMTVSKERRTSTKKRTPSYKGKERKEMKNWKYSLKIMMSISDFDENEE